MERISIPEYAMRLAKVAAMRSEDPYKKVGAVALDHDYRVIGTAYNGLAPGIKAPEGFWDSKQKRKPFMIHAEANLCSLITRGEVSIAAVTLKPCIPCMQMLCAYGVRAVYYSEEKNTGSEALADFYEVNLQQLTIPEIDNTLSAEESLASAVRFSGYALTNREEDIARAFFKAGRKSKEIKSSNDSEL